MSEVYSEDDNLGNEKAGEGEEKLSVPKDAAGNVDPDKAAPGGFPYPASTGPTAGAGMPDASKEGQQSEDKKEKGDEDKDEPKVDKELPGSDVNDGKGDMETGLKTGKKAKKAGDNSKLPGNDVDDPLKNDNEFHKDFFKPDAK